MVWAAALLLQTAAVAGFWLDVPFVHQQANGCGSASVWMVLQYWKTPSIPDLTQIHQDLFSKKADGIYASDMERYFRRQGFQTFVLEAGWQDLSEEIAQGRPIIVALERRPRGAPLHYVVVAGVDPDQQVVWLNDPAERKLLPMRRKDFERQWRSTNNWALLALPEFTPRLPEPERVSDSRRHVPELTQASAAFREKNFTEAESQLKSLLRSDSDDSLANDFLGTVYLLDNNLDAALKYWNRVGKPKVGQIHIDPPLRLDPIRLDRTFAFSRASVLNLKTYEETRRRLDALDTFSRYSIELEPGSGEEFNLKFRASERDGPEFLSWFRGLPYQTVYPGWRNIHGQARNLESEFRWQAGNRRAVVGFSSPLRQNSSLTYRIQVDGRNEEWQRDAEAFNLHRAEVSTNVHAIFADGWNWTNGIAAARRSFSNSFPGGNSISYRTAVQRSLLQIPERHLTLESSAGAELGKLFGTEPERFAKARTDFTLRWFPFPTRADDYEIRAALRLGKSLGELPFDELFVLGLDRDSDLRLRAHPAMESGRKGAAPMARDYALLNYDLGKRVYSNGLFRVDAGPFLDTARIPSQGQWLVDTGMQLRISVLGAFKLGVSFGRDLRTGRQAMFIDGSK
jgi:predicted double-glycine peptidase